MKLKLFAVSLLISVALLAGCSSAPKVERISADKSIDLSGRWNDTDSKLVAEQMITDVLSRNWLLEFVSKKSTKPVVIVGAVRNLSSEHIDTGTFIKNMERELTNSGRVRFVASKEDRKEIRDERLDQQSSATEETSKRLAAETGADFMLQGAIRTIIDAIEGKQVKLYQVDLELIDIENNEKVWLGNKEIKKFVIRSRAKW
jgi:uncharacterized protein (TIGR02722 family)